MKVKRNNENLAILILIVLLAGGASLFSMQIGSETPLTSCDSTSGWISNYCTKALDTSNKVEGTGSVKFTVTGPNAWMTYWHTGIVNEFRGHSTMKFWAYPTELSTSTGLSIGPRSGPGWTVSALIALDDQLTLDSQWQEITVDFTSKPEINLSDIRGFSIIYKFESGIPSPAPTINLDDIRLVETASPSLTISISPNSAGIYTDETQTFTATASHGTGSYTYEWYINDILETGATSSSHTVGPLAVGTYTVKVEVNDGEDIEHAQGILTVNERTSPGTATYTLNITATQGGTTTPAPGTYSYEEDTVAEITAIPEEGYKFVQYLVDGSNDTQLTITITMDADYNVEAVFTPLEADGSSIPGTTDLPEQFASVDQTLMFGIIIACVLVVAIIVIRKKRKG